MPRKPRRTLRVGVVWNAKESSGGITFLGIKEYARLHGPWEIYSSDDYYPRRLPSLDRWNGDGIVGRFAAPELIAAAVRSGIPAVNIADAPKEMPFPRILVDNRAIGRRAAEHLLEMGFRRFATVSSSGWSAEERRAGFREKIDEAGFDCSEDYPYRHDAAWDRRYGKVSKALVEWLKQLRKSVGILAAYDRVGSGVIRAILAAELRIPEDAAVVSSGNNEMLCECAPVSLSSVEIPYRRMGYEAAAMLDRIMQGRKPPKKPLFLEPGDVVQRSSSGLAADVDPDTAEAIQFIRRNAYGPLCIGDVIQNTGVSRKTLENRFHEVLGRCPYEEVTRLRLERAQQLLRETVLPVTQVAKMSGFTDGRHISVVFRKNLDMTPTEFRLRSQTTNP